MDLIDEYVSVPSSPKTTKDDQMEPGVLLEESWFFGNLLDRKSRMLRCYSDPCPSSKTTHQDMLAGKTMEETFSSLQKLPRGERLTLDSRRSNPRLQGSNQNNLKRTPSLPVYVDYKEEEIHDEESDFSMGKLIRQASINHVKVSPPKQTSQVLPKTSLSNLQRAPSLPVFVDKEVIQDEDHDFSMGKLIRQASLNHARVLPPKYTSKQGLTKCSSISSTAKHHLRRKQEQESSNSLEGSDDMRRKHLINQSKTRNSSIEDLQSFKNLDINNEKKDSIPKLPNATPSLKEKNKIKKPVGLSELDKIRRPPYSPEDHMKEQIKFWARAVASNVR